MATLRYKTRGGSSPQGKPRAFFFGKQEDLDLYFEEISEDILDEINCAVYYPSWIDGGSEAQKIGEFDIAQMNVIVVPVSRRLLSAEDAELDGWLDAARKNNVPILPLMQESGLDALFEKKFGSLQYLDKNKVDSTAIPYEEKLRSFLSAVMLGDELSEKIRSAFDAYIFLSYWKKDREYAQKLMKLIHENDFARDVAIWYDEFLTPGEDFNELISRALEKSSLFVLTVTPNVVNEINYIMNIEYPMAVERGKPVAPVEMVKTDESELRRLYSGIPSAVPAEDAGSLAELLRSKLSGILEGGTRDPKHRFFMGLAYLSGIDVERDAQRGMSLLKEAADEGFEEAFEKISDAYYFGDGVEQDCEEALKWRRRLDDIYGEKADKSRDDDDLHELIKRRMRYGELAYEAGVYDKALWAFDVTSEGARQLAVGSVKTNPFRKILGIASKITGRGKYYSEGMYMMIRCLRYMADIYHAMGQTDKAAECGAKAAKIGAGLGETSDGGRIYGELFMIYSRMGRMCLESGNSEGAGYWFGEMSKVFIEAPEVQTGLNEAELYTGYCLYYQARGDLESRRSIDSRIIDIVHELGTERDDRLRQAGIAVRERVGVAVKRGLPGHLAIRTREGEEEVIRRLGDRGSAVVARIERTGRGLIVGMDPEGIGCREGENLLRGGLRRREEELTEIRMERIDAKVHTGLAGSGAGLPVAHIEGDTGLHGQGCTLGHALGSGIALGKSGNGIVKVLVDILQDDFTVDPAHLIGLLESNIIRIERNVAEEGDLVGIEAGAEELRFARILGHLLVWQNFFRLVEAIEDRIGTGDAFVVVRPVGRSLTPSRRNRASEPVVELGPLVPVIGPAVRIEKAGAFGAPESRLVQVVQGKDDFLLTAEPVLAGSFGKRIPVQVDAGGQKGEQREC